jgi:hypothetical protein
MGKFRHGPEGAIHATMEAHPPGVSVKLFLAALVLAALGATVQAEAAKKPAPKPAACEKGCCCKDKKACEKDKKACDPKACPKDAKKG